MQSPPARTRPARETREWFAYLPPSALYTRRDVPLAGQDTAAQLRLAATHRYPLRKISIIPGIFEIHSSGRAHQISRARATAASAPPNRLPSLRRNCISRIKSSRGSPSSAPTRGSCNGASAIPRRSRIGASHLAIRVQNRHSASKNNHPRACRPFPSVYSLTSEIILRSERLARFDPPLCDLEQRSRTNHRKEHFRPSVTAVQLHHDATNSHRAKQRSSPKQATSRAMSPR